MSVTFPALPQVHMPREQRVGLARPDRWYNDTWLLSVILLATAAGTIATYYIVQHHLALIWVDSRAHMQIARRVFDSQTTGLAQLGGVWLPLPHIVMFPFIMFNALWATGLAGAIPSGIAYVIASGQIYLIARRLTNDSSASFIAALIFITNPNVLYLQGTPLSEMILIVTLTTSCYYFIRWAQEEHTVDLIIAGFSTFLATMARYDGWALYLVLLVAVVIIGIQRHYSFSKIQATLLVFGAAGGFGILMWFIWNATLFGDPLYFQRSPYSSQAQQVFYIKAGLDLPYHNLVQAIRHYTLLSVQTVGPILAGLGALGTFVYAFRKRFSPEVIAALTLFVPYVFYVVALYTGQAIIFTIGATPSSSLAPTPLYNVRYGVMIVAPVAIFASTLVANFNFGKILMAGAVIVQVYLIGNGGIISLQEGEHGVSCFKYSGVTAFMARHYNGGLILDDPFNNLQDYSQAGIPYRALVTQSAPGLWAKAISNPAAVVDWVVTRPSDQVAANIPLQGDAFTSKFTLAYQDANTDVSVYVRNGANYVVDRPIDQSLLIDYNATCGSAAGV